MNPFGAFEEGVQFDPYVTVPRDILWDPTASSLGGTDPDDLTPGPSKSPTHANPSEREKDEHVVPVVGNFVTTFEASNDYNEDIELARTAQRDQGDALSSLMWNILQQGPEQSNTDDHDEMAESELPEMSMDFAAVVWCEDDEDFMQVDASGVDEAAVFPLERPPVIFEQFLEDMHMNSS